MAEKSDKLIIAMWQADKVAREYLSEKKENRFRDMREKASLSSN